MPPIVPSYIGKVGRAEKHLVDLKAAIDNWGGPNAQPRPYTVRKRRQSKRQRWELHFTAAIENTDAPLIAADAIYNLHSSLDHLIAACVKAEDRDSVSFPVFWQGVWEPVVPGENTDRTKHRQRWTSTAKRLPADAVAILKSLQPPDQAPGRQEGHILRVLRHLANTDDHTHPPLIAHGLKGMLIVWQLPDGSIQRGWTPPDPGGTSYLEDGAEVQGVPHGAVYVDGYGAPEVVIRGAVNNRDPQRRDVPLIAFIEDSVALIRDRIIPGLAPFVWKSQKRRR